MEEDDSIDGITAAMSPQDSSSDFSEDSTQGARRNFLRMIEEEVVVDELGDLTIGGEPVAPSKIAEESQKSSSSSGNSVEVMRGRRQSEKASSGQESGEAAGMDLESSNGESRNSLEMSEYPTTVNDAADFGGSDRLRKRSVTRSPDSMGASQLIEDYDDLEVSLTAGDKGRSRKKLRKKSKGGSGIDNLFEAVKDGNIPISRIVDTWLEKYKDKRYEGALEIIQFLVNSTGSVFKLTEDMLGAINAYSTKIDIFEEMANNTDEEALYPLVRKDKQWQNFAGNFNKFMKKWTCECVEMLACNGDFTEKLFFLIIPLTKSPYRAFRHTATVAALHFGDALLRYMEELRQNIGDAERQLKHEMKKPEETASPDRIFTLQVGLDSLTSSFDKASAKLSAIEKNVFQARYRDTCPGIRSACIRVFGNWMKVSSMRVNKKKLFYLSLMLRDEMPEVKKACIEALLELYENHTLKNNLSEFTQTSKGKILALAVDNDLEVAELGVVLVSAIQRMYDGMFSPEESSVIYSLMFAEGRNLAVAAASFFTATYGEFLNPSESSDSGRTDSQSAVSRILAIARYIVTSDTTSEDIPFLVDALYSTERSIQNWEAIGNVLMESQDHSLTQEEEGILIMLLRYSAERHSGVIPVGRFPTNKRILPSAAAKVSALQAELTEVMLPILPTLLTRFLIDPKKLMHLLTVPQFFESKIMAKATHKGSVKRLVNSVGDVIERIAEPEILESCGKCLAMVAAVEGLTEVKGYETAVTERVWNTFDRSLGLYIYTLQSRAGKAGSDTTANMAISLKKLSVISSYVNFESYKPWEIVCILVKRVFRNNMVLSTEVIQSAVAVLYHSVLWGLKHIRQIHEDAQLGTEDKNAMILEFKRKVSLIANLLNKFLKPGYQEIVCEAGSDVFQMLCDLMTLFSSSAKPIRGIEPPIIDREEAIIESMLAVIQSYVLEMDDPTDGSEERCFLLSLLCKLIVTQSVNPSQAGRIFKYYDKVGSKLVSILKATLIELRSKCQPELGKLMLSSLSLHLQDSLDSSSPNGIESTLKLARNFASILGPDASKYSETLTTLHEEGIALATEYEDASEVPKMITLLEVLVEFSYKLSAEDRAKIRDKLKSVLPEEAMEQDREDEKWKSVIEYVESLGDDDEGESSRPRRNSRVRSRTSGISRRTSRRSRRVGNTTTENQ